jgi:hypothetical protein
LSLGPKTVLHGLANLGRLIGGRPLLGLASLDPLLGHAGGGRYQRPEQVADVGVGLGCRVKVFFNHGGLP